MARDQLDALAGVVEDLAGQFELRPLLERILRHAADLLGYQSGSICTVDQRLGTYRKEVDLGVACRSGDEFPLTEGVTGEILARRWTGDVRRIRPRPGRPHRPDRSG